MTSTLSGMTLRDLEYVLAVASHLHFGRAAAACGVSQPALSAQVLKLERYLGFALFERMPSGTRLTEDGAEFARRASAVVVAARDLLSSRVDPRGGVFRLGAIPTLGPYLLPLAMRPIRTAFPALRLLFTEARTAALSAMLRDGELDAILVCTPADDSALVQHDLFTEPLVLMHPPGAAPAWPPAPGQMLTLDDGHCLRDHVLAACGGLSACADRHATGLDLLHHMVAAGDGMSLIPELAAARLGTADGLVAFSRPACGAVERDVLLVARRSHPRGALIAELAAVLSGVDRAF